MQNKPFYFCSWLRVRDLLLRNKYINPPIYTSISQVYIRPPTQKRPIYLQKRPTCMDTWGAGVETQETKQIFVPLSKKDTDKKSNKRWT